MNSEFDFNDSIAQNGRAPHEKPTLLTILCILSIIGGITQGISNLIMGMMFPMVKELMNSEEFLDLFPEMYIESMEQIFSVDRICYFLNGILYIASFTGALYMWRLKKIGFHIYTIAQILILAVSSFFVYPNQEVSTFYYDLILSLIFVFLYFRFYKRIME